jgi:carbon storage regulator
MMLVLSRKLGEEVVIGDNIRLAVVAIDRNRVWLGVTAPPDVLILRDELCSPADQTAGPGCSEKGTRPISRS